ncbi:MAG TPA: TonB-dependent receptor, partial [Chitinophagaceae bacterium]|nr:TonB-dependent receptor [Chitinophagaceae bacterium]
MKKLAIILTAAFGLLSFDSQSQMKYGRVYGSVIDGNTKTIEQATITLLRAKDSSIVKMAAADNTGKFTFDNVPDGRYLVSISAVGHQNGYSGVFEVTPSNSIVNLKTIELMQQQKSLSAVTIVAKKPLIEQKIDRTIVNVEASVTNVGNSALEVLEKAPGVSVDKDGNISLKGKSGVQVYIDGRPAYLSGEDLANMLRNMSASQLDQIEIMTNPPSKYDAAGNSGVINIKTKKNKQFGYNGSLTTGYTQGVYARYNEGFNFNYRTSKINLFSNLSYNYNKRKEELYINRNFRDINTKNILSEFDQTSVMTNSNDFYSAKVGLDYFASKKTTLGVVLNGFNNPGTWSSNTNTFIYDPNGALTNQT